ncbi:MAG: indole-3-glycerol phosphate synthase TrpC [Firmicutes bacterium]|nr:indole-3-glycerol phosphate synthase TrpC [Bacillota bacterium]
MILDRIVAYKKKQIEMEKQVVSMEQLKEKLRHHRPGTRDFYNALNKPGEIAVIAEVKKASPSKGIICHDFNPVQIAHTYYKNEVEAISVLTEKQFFMGADEYLQSIRQNVPTPLLRKDFIIDCWQIYQSKMLGADAILLIVSILDDEQLKKFQIVAGILGMACLVEVHNEQEVERALLSGAKVIGINNRNLKTFEVSLRTTEKLIGLIPEDVLVVSESGIKDGRDLNFLKQQGVGAVLIGETLVKHGHISQTLRELRCGVGV